VGDDGVAVEKRTKSITVHSILKSKKDTGYESYSFIIGGRHCCFLNNFI